MYPSGEVVRSLKTFLLPGLFDGLLGISGPEPRLTLMLFLPGDLGPESACTTVEILLHH